jgi:hypothetical protein
LEGLQANPHGLRGLLIAEIFIEAEIQGLLLAVGEGVDPLFEKLLMMALIEHFFGVFLRRKNEIRRWKGIGSFFLEVIEA